jgi:hypothetical protein
MKLIMHIGMGKTGTSSIQNSLRTQTEALKAQKVHYLGMWFDFIDPAYSAYGGNEHFYEFARTHPAEVAQKFVSKMSELQSQSQCDTFILSNESIFAKAASCVDFLQELRAQIDVQIVVYIRDPHDWLPSAYTQWELRHKTRTGPLRPFGEAARHLIKTYDAYTIWDDALADILTTRRHDKGIDTVQDFAAATGLTLAQNSARQLERSEPAETLLRAAFNNRIPAAALPNRFNAQVVNTSRGVPRLEDFAQLCFTHDGIDTIIEERRPMFELLRDRLGPEFDFLSTSAAPAQPHDMEAIRARLLDYLVEIAFVQGDRIRKLEKQIKDLTDPQ